MLSTDLLYRVILKNEMDFKDEHRSKSRNLSEKKRRDQFNVLINELSAMVSSNDCKMDKSTVLRSTISFFRNHNKRSVQQQTVEDHDHWKPSFLSNEEFSYLMLEALDGFILVLGTSGKILFASESISSILGYLPSDLPSSVFDIVLENDQSSLHELLNSSLSDLNSSKDSFSNILLHMKHGPILSENNCSTYDLIQLTGTFHHCPTSTEGSEPVTVECGSLCSPLSSSMTVDWPLCFVALGKLQVPKLMKEVSFYKDLTESEFTSRHSLEWTFLFLDHRAPTIIGYLPFEVLGTSGYDYYHVDDLEKVASGHEMVMKTGEGMSCCYRFLTKGQQWIWLQTRYYISYHQWSSKPEFVVCSNVVVSNDCVHGRAMKIPKASDSLASGASVAFTPSRNFCFSPTPSVSSFGSLSSGYSAATSRNSHTSMFPPHGQEKCSEKSDSNKMAKRSSRKVRGCFSSQAAHVLMESKSSAFQPASSIQQSPLFRFPTSPAFVPLPGPSNEVVSDSGSELAHPMTADPMQVQEYLRKRHELLQQQILLQQEELRRVSEQLMLVQFVAPSATAPVVQYSPTIVAYPSTAEVSLQRMYPLLHNEQKPQQCSGHLNLVEAGDKQLSAVPLDENAYLNQRVGLVSPHLPHATS